MLAAAQRVRRRADFADTIRTGRRAGRGTVVVHLTLPAAPPTGPAPTRAGFVVSKAVGGAVTRNLVRRRLRHLARERLVDLPAGSALVVRALPGAADRPYAQLGADLDGALAAARAARPERSR
jgi:ribonuclease P protein component